MNFKSILVSVLFLFSGALGLFAQEETNKKKESSIGFQLNQYSNDFGLGINYSSPKIINGYAQIRAKSNAMFFEYVENGETIWEPYFNLMLGFSSATTRVSEAIGLYGEGGAILILPSNKFSSEAAEVGGYGLFGFEFYFNDYFAYFLEAGGIGIGTTANKLANKPIYSNGFLMSVGFKMKL